MNEFAPQRLRRKALDLADEAIHRLGDIGHDAHEAVHDVRRRLKELRALGALLGVSREEIALFRDAGRRLSAARDAKAAVEAFDRLREAFAGEWTPRVYMKIRQALDSGAADAVDANLVAELRGLLDVERGAIAAWDVDGMTRDELWSAIRRSRRGCRRAMNDAVSDPKPALFHEWRKRTKTFWYEAQFMTEVGVADLDSDAKTLRKLSRLLGDHHDLTVIDEWCALFPERFGSVRYVRRFRTFIARRQRQLEATAEALATELLEESSRDWELVHRRIGPRRAAVPAAIAGGLDQRSA